jgi:membrane-anchored protein YejM (alkaline phosphatase superfamily)
MMDVYAATVAQSDYEIGRIIDALEKSGQLDNTLVVYLARPARPLLDLATGSIQWEWRSSRRRPSSERRLARANARRSSIGCRTFSQATSTSSAAGA